MAWTKAAWADVIGTNASKAAISASATATGTFDCNGANPYITTSFKVVVVFGTAAAAGVKVEFLGHDADGAAEDDTLAMYEAQVPQVVSSEERATYQVNVSALDTVKVKLTNLDGNAITAWVAAMGAYQ